MNVWVHRVGVGRHEDARTATPHLVLIEIELGIRLVVHRIHPILRFHQVGLEEVPVVVVSCVVVVEPRHAGPFVVCTHVLPVPVRDEDLSVRIGGGDKHRHDIVENRTGDLIVSRGQQVDQVDAGLRRPDFRRVDVVVDERRGREVLRDAFGFLLRDPTLRDPL